MATTCLSCNGPVPIQATFCPSCGMRVSPNQAALGYVAPAVPPGVQSLSAGLLLGGRYRLEAPIASGAMGSVWRARDERLYKRPCAVKSVLLGGATREEYEERVKWFARETEVLSGLHHSAICDIRDVIFERHVQYLILELVEGRTLAQELAIRGKPGLPAVEVLSWAATLCDALLYLHTQTPPVIFRDLKPQNIMLRPDGRVTLIDFGVARSAITAGGTAIGTGGYAAPEQYQGLADARSDVYGLAATLHHLLTGRDPTRQPPFAFPAVRTLVPTLSSQTEEALAQALHLVSDRRFASIDELEYALRATPPVNGHDN